MLRARNLLGLLFGLAMLAGTAACGGGDAGQGGGGTSEGGVLRLATTTVDTTLDPHLMISSYSETIMDLFYDRLVHRDPDGNPVPGLATGWEFSQDGLTVTLTLRDDVTFQDGQPFNAAAVVASLNRGKTLQGSRVAAALGSIDSADAVNDYTVALHLNRRDAGLLAWLATRAGAMISPAALNNPDLGSNPVGAGMFKVTAFTPLSLVKLEAWDGYWDPAAVKVDRFEVHIMNDSLARLNAIRSGAVDIAALDPDQVAQTERAGIKVLSRLTVAHGAVWLNRGVAPFNDVRVRQAMNYAVDRQGIVDSVLFGQGEANDQPFPSNSWAHNEAAVSYDYDPERARTLLAEAGYPNGFDFRLIILNNPANVATMTALIAQWEQVGIRGEAVVTEPTQVGVMFLNEKSEATNAGVAPGRADPSHVFTLYYTENIINPCGGTGALGAVSPEKQECLDDQISELFLAQLSEYDQAKRAEHVDALTARAAELAMNVYLYNPLDNVAIGDHVEGLELSIIGANGGMEFRGVSVAKP